MLWDENADGADGHLENLGKAYLRTKPTQSKVQMKYGKVMQYPWWSLSEDYMYFLASPTAWFPQLPYLLKSIWTAFKICTQEWRLVKF